MEKRLPLLIRITQAQMKARYRRTFAGFVWVILSPIVLYAAQALVFKYVLKLDLPNYGLFLLGGLLPWVFIVSSLEMGIPALTGAREIFLAMNVPPYLFVLSTVLDNAVNFLFAFLIVLVPTVIISGVPIPGLWLLPLAVVPLVAGAAGMLWLLAVLNVFYRDVRFVVHFAIGVLFFATPIFYPREFVPAEYQWLIAINPVYMLIEPLRLCVYRFEIWSFLQSLGKSVVCAGILCAMAGRYWSRRKNEFYFYL